MKLIVKTDDHVKIFNVIGKVRISVEDGYMYLKDSSREKTESIDLYDEDIILISFDLEEVSKEIVCAEEIKMLRTEDALEVYSLMNVGFVVSKNSPYQIYHPLTNVEVCRVTSSLLDHIANQKLVDNSNPNYITLKR